MRTYIVQNDKKQTAGSSTGKYVFLFYDKTEAHRVADEMTSRGADKWHVREIESLKAEEV